MDFKKQPLGRPSCCNSLARVSESTSYFAPDDSMNVSAAIDALISPDSEISKILC